MCEKSEEIVHDRENFQRGGGSASFFFLAVSVAPTAPHALEVTRDLDKEESRDGMNGNDFGTQLPGCDGGIDERPREEGDFANLFPPISDTTEVTRELD
jgi:hypothetical protein